MRALALLVAVAWVVPVSSVPVGHVHRAGTAGAGSYREVASSEAGVLLEKNVEPGFRACLA